MNGLGASMASAVGLTFKRNAKVLDGAADVGVQIIAVEDPAVATAILTNSPFPDKKIELGQILIGGEAGKDIQFGEGRAQVTFPGKANAFTGLGVYPDPKDVVQLLVQAGLNEHVMSDLKLAEDSTHTYVALQWGYDIEGAANGSVALGAGASVKFGVDAQRDALYAIVRRLDKTEGASSAIQEILSSWILPRQVTSVDDLAPGTYVVAEVDGSIGLKIGAQYGFDFNWVREAVSLGGLTGDIGLRVQLGVATTLGFNAGGQYAVLVSRESLRSDDRVLRFRLFKLSKKGWDFAFSAAASVQADLDKFLPGNFDDFVKAVFNVHGLQVLKDFEKWTDPASQLSDLLGAAMVQEAERLLLHVTGLDPKTQFEQARGRLQDLLRRWHALPHPAASALYSIIRDEKQNLLPFKNALQKLATGVPAAVVDELGDLLRRVDFFRTPLGKWLEVAAARGIMSALSDRDQVLKIQETAKNTLGILDGSTVESLFTKLQAYIEGKLHLALLEGLTKENFGDLDGWLKARLSHLLGKEIDFSDVEKIRTVIHTLLAKRGQFYARAREALTRKYQFEFAATYQTTTAGTALLDFELDYRQGGAELDEYLQKALKGDFNTVLVERQPGISLNQGTLTHEITRSSHSEVTLPFHSSALDHINDSLASVQAVDTDGGRLLVYDLDAKDVVARRNMRDSRLAIGAQVDVGGGIRIHDKDAMTYSYSFRQAIPEMKRSQLQYQLQSYVDTYFPQSFTGDDKQPFDTWIGDLDTAIEQVLRNGKDNFGNTLVSLEVSVPGRVVAAWKNAPAAKHAQAYMAMSRYLQAKLKELIPFCYFQNPLKYTDLLSATALIVYASLPVSTAIDRSNGELSFDTISDVYWNWPDEDLRAAVVMHRHTVATLAAKVASVRALLAATPGLQGWADRYQPGKVGQMLLDVTGNDAGKALLASLLFVEARVVRGAQEAGVKLAKFLAQEDRDPSDAVKALAEFGEQVTDAFNERIASVYRGDELRPLGTMAFIEASRALSASSDLGEVGINAMLDLIVLKEKAEFELGTFLQGAMPEAGDVVRQERLVNLGATR